MLETNKIHQGDCLEIMKNIPDKSVDLILCDLPYGTTACSWDEIIPLEQLWYEYKRIIRNNGFIILTASQPFTTKLIMSNIQDFSHEWIWEKEQGANPLLANIMPMKNFENVIVFYNEYKKYDYEFKNPLRDYSKKLFTLINKSKKDLFEEMGNQGICHFMRISTIQFSIPTEETYNQLLELYNLKELEWILTFNKLKEINKRFDKTLPDYPRIYNPQKTKGKRYTSGKGYLEHLGFTKAGGTISEERYPTSIIRFNTDKSKSKHPTQKPVALFEYLIKTYSNEGDLVLDNCAGSGTTGVACINTNRRFILIEKEEKYCDIANKRLQQDNLRDWFKQSDDNLK